MNRRLLFLSCVALAGLLACPLRALPQTPAASSHENAARELYRMMGGARAAEVGADLMMGMVRGNPEVAPYEHVFRAWLQKVFAGGAFEAEIAKLYMNTFSEQELQGLIAFYRTPLGQKAIAKIPELAKQGGELGMKWGQEHLPELQEMLSKAKKEREAQKSPGQ